MWPGPQFSPDLVALTGGIVGPFRAVEGVVLVVCVQSRELGARASPSEFYPAGKLQWQFTCGFDFGHCLWSLEGVNGKLHFLWSAVDDFQLYSIVIPNSKSSWNSTHEVDIQHSFLFKYLSLVLTGRVFAMLVFTLRC